MLWMLAATVKQLSRGTGRGIGKQR